MSQVAVIGTTSWGNTLGLVFAGKGLAVRMWARTEPEADRLREQEFAGNPSGVIAPPQLSVTSRLPEALAGAAVVILAVPSQRMRQNISLVRDYLDRSMLLVSAAKGLELDSHKRMSQVIAEEIPPDFRTNICVLSGPNLSREVRRGLPAAAVVAARDQDVAERAQKLLSTEKFCLYTSTDIVGVELGGALKNIVALGAGIVDGLGFGDNTKAAFITRGLIEVAALGVALGAHPLTFTGLAGLGDTIATCASPLSRNHYVGAKLAKGRSLDEIIASMTGVAEGVNTAIGAHSLARELGLGMPVLEKIYQILFEGADPRSVVKEITSAEASHELAGQNWDFSSFSRSEPTD